MLLFDVFNVDKNQPFDQQIQGKMYTKLSKISELGTLYGNNPNWKQLDFEYYHSKSSNHELQNDFINFEEYADIEKKLRLARNMYMEEHGNFNF